ncbi:GNAT family N-acetyltransferase [Nocardioides sp. YIM 152315]|uniref:GNAT family N-acetyltransferase n=1 Tax=Nocardioides sp. YIM 152315 TaxID=3031760 RepID=UPI0023DA9D3B|nr:GNAT family N-acetyltransferase [Nocardioides sp. YIM 152315]MDF1602017.1 GNAT family N-acetyltransferase [Nocardioides sp. YIM 152315]
MSDFQIVPLDNTHALNEFSSGEQSLDDWLRKHALANQIIHSSRTFVLVEPDSPRVWGYYSLTVASIQREDATKTARSGMPQAYDIPAVLLARLARDEKRRAEGLGPLLLADAVLRTIRMSQDAGVRVLAVHAVNDKARSWYIEHDFLPSPIHDRLLMLSVPDLLATWDSVR